MPSTVCRWPPSSLSGTYHYTPDLPGPCVVTTNVYGSFRCNHFLPYSKLTGKRLGLFKIFFKAHSCEQFVFAATIRRVSVAFSHVYYVRYTRYYLRVVYPSDRNDNYTLTNIVFYTAPRHRPRKFDVTSERFSGGGARARYEEFVSAYR